MKKLLIFPVYRNNAFSIKVKLHYICLLFQLLMPAKSHQKSFQHRHTVSEKDQTSRASSFIGSNVIDSGSVMASSSMTIQPHQSDLTGQYSESAGPLYRRRRCRSLLLPYQINRLNKAFAQSQYISSEMKAQLAQELQLSASVIGV